MTVLAHEMAQAASRRYSDDLMENYKAVGLDKESQSDRLSLSTNRPRAGLRPSSSQTSSPCTLSEDLAGSSDESVESCFTDESREDPESDSKLNALDLGTPPLTSFMSFPDQFDALSEEDIQVISHSSVDAFLQEVATAGYGTEEDASWRLAPILGPARALQKFLSDEKQAGSSVPVSNSIRPRTPHSTTLPRVFLTCWSITIDNGRRLDMVLTKLTPVSPVLLASPLQLHSVSPHALKIRIDRLITHLKHTLPPALFSPGGSIRSASLSPLNNVYAVYGPSALVDLFAQNWSLASHSDRSNQPIGTQQFNYRLKRMKLTHLPRSSAPKPVSLLSGFCVRLATTSDDMRALAKMLKESRQNASFIRNEYVSFDTCLRDVERAIRRNACWIYEVSSKTLAGLRFYPGLLLVGCETGSAISVQEIYVREGYRNRGIAEALFRDAAVHYLNSNDKEQLICLVPDSAEMCARVMARVGFRILDKSCWEDTEQGLDEGLSLVQTHLSLTKPAFLSWERWICARFTAISTGCAWYQHC